jgi:hypothetical protein
MASSSWRINPKLIGSNRGESPNTSLIPTDVETKFGVGLITAGHRGKKERNEWSRSSIISFVYRCAWTYLDALCISIRFLLIGVILKYLCFFFPICARRTDWEVDVHSRHYLLIATRQHFVKVYDNRARRENERSKRQLKVFWSETQRGPC